GTDAGGATLAAITNEPSSAAGASNWTISGTSPVRPEASNLDSGTVATISAGDPQSPGHKSIVSFTMNLMSGTTVMLPVESWVSVALISASRESLKGDGVAPIRT